MYDHTLWKTRDPVRSPIDKPERAELVVGSVTTGESLVLYIGFYYFLIFSLVHFPAPRVLAGLEFMSKSASWHSFTDE